LSQQKINDIITKKEGWINKKIQHFQQNHSKSLLKSSISLFFDNPSG